MWPEGTPADLQQVYNLKRGILHVDNIGASINNQFEKVGNQFEGIIIYIYIYILYFIYYIYILFIIIIYISYSYILMLMINYNV